MFACHIITRNMKEGNSEVSHISQDVTTTGGGDSDTQPDTGYRWAVTCHGLNLLSEPSERAEHVLNQTIMLNDAVNETF